MLSKIKAFNTKHPRTWLVLFLVVPLLFAVLSAKAYGAEPTQSAPSVTQSSTQTEQKMCRHTNGDGGCWFGPRVSAKKFRHGYFHRAHGLAAKRIFKAPKAARAVFVKKIAHKIGNLPAKHRLRIVHHFFGSTKDPSNYGCTDYCLAWKMYGQLSAKAGCVGNGPPTTTTNTCLYTSQSSITKRGVQQGGAVVICGVLVVVGVVTAPETAGTSTVALSASAGAFSCGWSAWSMFDS